MQCQIDQLSRFNWGGICGLIKGAKVIFASRRWAYNFTIKKIF